MNMKIIQQSFVVRSFLKLVLNRLKEMRGLISIYTPLGLSSRKLSMKLLCVY